jgi:hypothetical protein
MSNTDDERETAAKAPAILNSLTPTTTRTDALVHSLRMAASAATNASKHKLSSDAALNNVRSEAATSLNGLAGLLHRNALAQEMIDCAISAVAAWLSALPGA